MENFFKKLGFGAAVAAGTMGNAEAQQPAAPHATETIKEQSASPKTAWAKEIIANLDAMDDPHALRDLDAVIATEKNFIELINSHLANEGSTYAAQDYAALLGYYEKINRKFGDWEEQLQSRGSPEDDHHAFNGYNSTPNGDQTLDRIKLLNSLKLKVGRTTETPHKVTAAYPIGKIIEDGGSQ